MSCAGGLSRNVRPYRGADLAAFLRVWNAALPYDAISAETLRQKVILDPNFDAEKLLVAETGGELVGFCLYIERREPFGGSMDEETGWITAMGVHPDHQGRGIGSAILGRCIESATASRRRRVLIAPYLPNYFVPGVDEANYADGLAFLLSRGFEVISRPMSMDARIVLLDTGQWEPRGEALRAAGVDVRVMREADMPELLALLREHMPYDWLRDARELLRDGGGEIIIAEQSGEAVGYCQFRGEHFGPFGVREGMQGRGIGTVLLAQCLEAMRSHGHHNAWVLWTSDETAAKVYSKFGFRETRRFAVLKREL